MHVYLMEVMDFTILGFPWLLLMTTSDKRQ